MALLSWVNWLDHPQTALAATSEAGSLSAQRLREPALRKRWRSLALPASFSADFGTARPIGVVHIAQPDDAGGVEWDGTPRGHLGQNDFVRHTFDGPNDGLFNVLLQSESLSSSPWSIFGSGSVAADTLSSPVLTQNAENITFSAGAVELGQGANIPADSSLWNFSIWLRPGSATSVLLRLRFGTDFLRYADAICNLQSGTISSAVLSPTNGRFPVQNATAEAWDNGWTRFSFSFANDGRGVVSVSLLSTSAGSVGAWGAQLVRSPFPNGYRPTATAPSETTFGTGSVLDSKLLTNCWAKGYGVHTFAPPTTVSAQRYRCDITAPSLSAQGFLDIGRAWVGPAWNPGINFEYGWGLGWDDLSVVEENPVSGLESVDFRSKRRTATFGFGSLTGEEARNSVMELQRLAGTGRQVLFVPDPSSPYVTQEAILGRLTEINTVFQPNFAEYSAAFSIRQTL